MDEFAKRLLKVTNQSDRSIVGSTDPVRVLELQALFETYLPTASEAEIQQVASIQEDLHQLHARLERLLEDKVINRKEYARTVNIETAWAMRRCAQVLGRERCEQLFGDDALDEKSALIPERLAKPHRNTSQGKRERPSTRVLRATSARGSAGGSKGYVLTPSAALGEVVGTKPLPRTEVTKKLWLYIKKNKLQDPKNKRMIKADPTLKTVFGGKATVNMFEMTKLVGKHLK